MKVKDRYAIDIFRLKPGQYEYDFAVNEDFFTLFTESPVKDASGNVHASMDKQEGLIRLQLAFDIRIPLVCDRSLRSYEYPMQENHEVVFKFGETEMEMDDDVYIITANTQQIHLEQILYELILLSVPMKKLHPELQGDDDEDTLIYESDPSDEKDDTDDVVDPRWEQLRKLKDK